LLILIPFSPAEAALHLKYKAYEEKSLKTIDTSDVLINALEPAGQIVKWTVHNEQGGYYHEYILNSDYTSREWTVRNRKEDMEYRAKRKGNVLHVLGVTKGKKFDKKIKIDDRPLIANPKVGLKGFVLSNQQSMECWSFRSSNLSAYEMAVKKLESETITFNGEQVPVVKVEWYAKSIVMQFFKQILYFRASDGVYLMQEPFRGFKMDLIGESESVIPANRLCQKSYRISKVDCRLRGNDINGLSFPRKWESRFPPSRE